MPEMQKTKRAQPNTHMHSKPAQDPEALSEAAPRSKPDLFRGVLISALTTSNLISRVVRVTDLAA